jgi:hypothetical protein
VAAQNPAKFHLWADIGKMPDLTSKVVTRFASSSKLSMRGKGEVIESKHWKHKDTGATASLYGAVPWSGSPGDKKEDWKLESVGWTIQWEDGTIGIGRQPFKTKEEAEDFLEKHEQRGKKASSNGALNDQIREVVVGFSKDVLKGLEKELPKAITKWGATVTDSKSVDFTGDKGGIRFEAEFKEGGRGTSGRTVPMPDVVGIITVLARESDANMIRVKVDLSGVGRGKRYEDEDYFSDMTVEGVVDFVLRYLVQGLNDIR